MASKRILVVDDEQQIVELLREVLTLRGYDTTEVGDPEEAIRIARNDLEIEVIAVGKQASAALGHDG